MIRGHQLRIAYFGTEGPLSALGLTAVAADHTVVAVIRPEARPGGTRLAGAGRRWLGAVARAVLRRQLVSLSSAARALGLPLWHARSGADPELAARLRAAGPDLLCIAGYPWLLRGDLLTAAPLGAVNLHAALLPRHRGPLPLFWIYYRDDRETGVTVHWVTEEADAGDIVAKAAFPLPRGLPVDRLNRLNAEQGAPLLRRALREIAAGSAPRQPQDATLATLAPRIKPGVAMVDFSTWDVERVWHFLAGLFPRFIEPLKSGQGSPIRYTGVTGFVREAHLHPPGTVLSRTAGYDLYCLGGRVHLAGKT